MADKNRKLIMGYWDCDQCGEKHIEGTKQSCPSCGKVRSTSTKFYMDSSNKQYLTDEEAKDKGNGEDWLCPYCGALNANENKTCQSCGSDRKDSEKGYAKMRQDEDAKAAEKQQAEPPAASSASGIKQIGLIIAAVLAIAVIAFVVFKIISPKTGSHTVETLGWKYTINIEQNIQVSDSDWYLPDDAELITTKREIQSYESVFDHYEYQDETYYEDEIVGYHTEYEYVDNGDGTFSEQPYQVADYESVEKTRTVEVPVYRQEPVYATKYYYYEWRWEEERQVITSADSISSEEPYWGETDLNDDERVSSRNEIYYVTATDKDGKKSETYTTTKDIWSQLEEGKSYTFTTKGSKILKLDTE